MIITGETDAEAKAKWDLYKSGADHEALRWLTQQSSADTKSGPDTNVRHMSSEVSNGQSQHRPLVRLLRLGGAHDGRDRRHPGPSPAYC